MDNKLGHIQEDSHIKICFITSEQYFQYMLVALYSFAKNKYPTTYADAYIVMDRVPRETQKQLDKFESKSLHIHKVDFDTTSSDFKYWVPAHSASAGYIAPITYARLYLTELLPDVDKIIYLDSDVLVDDDISELYEIDLDDNVIAAAKDYGLIAFGGWKNPAWSYFKELFPYLASKCFNAGVMLMDLEKLRRENYSQVCLKTFQEHPEFAFTDQDVLNYLYDDRTISLHPKWNNCLLCNEMYMKDLTYNKNYIQMFNTCFGTKYENFLHFSSSTKIYHFWGDKENFVGKNPTMCSLISKYKDGCDDFLKI